jgi:HK97 family phage portal protein
VSATHSGFLSRFRGRTEDRALTRENLPGSLLGAPSVAGPVGERAALRLVDVWACVKVISEAASTLPLCAYRRTTEGRTKLVGGSLVSLLERPAPGATQSTLIGQLVMSLATRGNGYVGMYSGADGSVAQLGVISPERIIIEVRNGAVVYRLTHLDGSQTLHGPDDIIHVRLPMTLDGFTGMSPIATCREALGLARALGEQASAAAVNDSTPTGVLTVAAGPGSDDLVENLRAAWESRHGGPRNKGRVAVVTGDVNFAGLSLSAVDAQFIEQRQLSSQEIARIWLVPPSRLNVQSSDSLTYSTQEGESLAFYRHCLAPYLTAVEQAVTNSPLCSAMTSVQFELGEMMRADSAGRASYYTQALNPATGWLDRNEVREMEGLGPAPAPLPVVDAAPVPSVTAGA